MSRGNVISYTLMVRGWMLHRKLPIQIAAMLLLSKDSEQVIHTRVLLIYQAV